MEDAERIRIYRSPGMEYNLDQCKHFVTEQAGNAIAALIRLFGIDEFQTMIDNRQAKPNPKYDMMIRQELERRKIFRFEELVDLIRKNPEIGTIQTARSESPLPLTM